MKTWLSQRCVLMVLAGLLAGFSTAQGQLWVDFSRTTGNVEAGYQAYKADHEVAATFTPQDFSAFGTTVTITPTWGSDATPQAMQMIQRGATAYSGDHVDLLYNWIGTDTRQPGNPLTLTIEGLPAGTLEWLSYHHDTHDQTGVFAVTVTDANGSHTTSGVGISNSDNGDNIVDFENITRFETTIVSNGTDPVTFVFEQTSGTLSTDPTSQKFFVLNGFEMDFVKRASNPDPENGETRVALDLSDRDRVEDSLSWLAPDNPMITDILGYELYLDPNETKVIAHDASCLAALTNLSSSVTSYNPEDFDWSTDYYWTVVTKFKMADDPNTYAMESRAPWMFRTIGAGPIIELNNLVAGMEHLPMTVTGAVSDVTDDLASVSWDVVGFPGDPVPAVAQMYDRGPGYPTSDPALLSDWIGLDTRQPGNPLIMTLSGLPAGNYTWTSTHHDPQNQTGLFDITVMDANGSVTTTDYDISIADETPMTLTLPIVSDGSDVTLVFSQHPYTQTEDSFFVMNSFILTGAGNPLNIDFGTLDSAVKIGYQAYQAEHEVLESFIPQSFTALNSTVTISFDWGPHALGLVSADIAKSNDDLEAPTATFTADTLGTYTLELTATDAEENVTKNTMTVTLAENACAAAQLLGDWPGYNYYDVDEDCDVDLEDFAAFSASWLDIRSISGPTVY